MKSRSRVVPGHAGSDSASEWMELNLREALLDLEERIYAGALGAMKVTDRARWRDVLEKGGYDACCPLPLEENGEVCGKDTPKMETDVDEDSNATVEAKQEEIAVSHRLGTVFNQELQVRQRFQKNLRIP